MGQALYRKYRSKSLSEVVGQQHVTTTLKNALKTGAISHAYLFTGPRGVGKTSVARILAHEVNNLPYNPETTHLDIIEIDAASNRRIDEIRELRDKIHTAPTSAKYKVYIIDEVHMLTREAFNALLKTLEEPPAHAIFILATTEAHKVPDTIISRTQRFSFKPIEKEEAISHLDSIAKQEGIKINHEALTLIAEHGGGSFRDSISMLDQLGHKSREINLKDVQTLLGIAPEEAVLKLLSLLQKGETKTLLDHLAELRGRGYQSAQLSHQLSRAVRQKLLEKKGRSSIDFVSLLSKLIDVPASHNPDALLELVLLEASVEQSHEIENLPASPIIEEPAAASLIVKEQPVETSESVKPIKTAPGLDDEVWQQVLQAIKRQHTTLYGIARMAVPEFKDGELILRFAFPFHQKRLNEEKNRGLISELVQKQTGQNVAIICIVDKTSVPLKPPAVPPQESLSDPLDSISNIFGSAEVLES